MAIEKKKIISLLIALTAAVVVLTIWWIGALQELENKFIDYRFKIRGQLQASKDIVIVAFDEESFKKLGRWPWPRRAHGKVVELLTKYGAKAIVFDMLLPEPDVKDKASDEYFAKALSKSGRVVLASYFDYDSEGNPVNFLLPVKMFNDKANTIGFANIVPELDGICRKIPVFKEFRGTIVPSLALAGTSIFLNEPVGTIIKGRKDAVDNYYEMVINYAGGYESFAYYSFYKVLSEKVAPEVFKNKIVLIGGTASGLFDFKAIPFSPTFPGVEIHANTMSNILLKNYLKPLSPWMTFIFIFLFAIIPTLVLSKFSPLKAGIFTLLAFLCYSFFVFFIFAKKNITAEYAGPSLSIIISYVGILFYRFITEEKEKRWIKKTFSHYLSAHVLESILADPSNIRLGGERKNLTVLFSDIRGFTTISEALKPEEVVVLLNEYLSKMVEIVFKHDGTLDKFIGDAVMVFWGAPIPQEDHPQKAVLCAIEMIEELKKLQEKWHTEGNKIIDIGIGINTGDMIVGNMGSKVKMEYTVIGDNVNLGSRIEGLNKDFKTHIIISDSTYQAVKNTIETRSLGKVKVKGKEKEVEIYEVIGRKYKV